MIFIRLVISLFIMVAVGASSVTSTQALLSDQATLGANTFSTGTVDLLVAKGQSGGSFQETQTGFTDSLLPGQTKTNYVRLKNNSSDVNFAIAAQSVNVGGNINPNDVTVTFTPVNSSEEPEGSSVSQTLAQWKDTPKALGTPHVNHGETQEYQIDVTLSQTVAIPGTTTFDFTFTGTQTP